ncbi:hypothetical protein BV898_06013 [Hypsibius exemplaris]|uniref:G-protein coupled receptors family 1 profile domain-containing protein n=1 Tax=Hypsibius exemplaris TaxID=2072580 RepID=A0A1W0WXU2_HYPEX|nr:hypothetical protein BV898_06013 [Hypsibius exemplaris]
MYASNNTTAFPGLNVTQCPAVFSEKWVARLAPGPLFSPAIILLQIFTLITFHRWHSRDPYLSLHVSLACSSLAYGIIGLSFGITTLNPWSDLVATASRALNYLSVFAHNSSTTTLLFISLDRWLSVEFPIQYRARISQKKVLFAIAGLWFVSFLQSVPGMIVYWSAMQAYCNRLTTFFYPSLGFYLWSVLTGPVLLSLTALAQLRIITIAVATKLRVVRARGRIGKKPTHGPAPVELSVLMGIIRERLLASVVVVIVQLFANVPYRITIQFASRYAWSSQTMAFWSMAWISVQHIFSPVVYLTFFRGFERLRKGSLVSVV